LQEVYGDRVRELEEQVGMESKNFDEMASQYNLEF
jgi:hypothetical protein